MTVSREELVERARALTPVLAAAALETEEKRRVPASTFGAFREAGLVRMLVPARVGGHELPFDTLIDTTEALARGCASSAWVLANLASHGWMLGMWPTPAQDEVWADGTDALIAGSLVYPAGRAHPVEGGYRLHGRWPFASGVDACSWTMLGGTVEDDDDDPGGFRIFLLPRADYAVNDTWFAAGLAGTASKEVAVEDVFVPAHRTVALGDLQGGPTPGSAANPGPLYRIPVIATAGHVVVGTVLGIARGAIEYFGREDSNRVSAHSGRTLKDLVSVQTAFAEASATAEAARRVVMADGETIMRLAATDARPGVLDKARLRRDCAFASRLATQAVDLLFTSMGGGAVFLNHPLQRAFRDVHAAGAHIALNWARATQHFGKAVLGHLADIPPHER